MERTQVLKAHPAGEMFYGGSIQSKIPANTYKFLTKVFDRDIDDCALDLAASKTGPQFHNICC